MEAYWIGRGSVAVHAILQSLARVGRVNTYSLRGGSIREALRVDQVDIVYAATP